MASEVYLDGTFVGTVESGEDFAKQLVRERRKTTIDNNMNIFFDEILNEVHVEVCSGRVRRPLIIVKEGVTTLTENHIKTASEKRDDMV